MFDRIPSEVLKLIERALDVCISRKTYKTYTKICIVLKFSRLVLKPDSEPYYLEAFDPEVEIILKDHHENPESEIELWEFNVWWSNGQWYNDKGEDIELPEFLEKPLYVFYDCNPDGTGKIVMEHEKPFTWEVE